MQKINEAGLNIIKHFEDLRLKAYRCPSGIWTIGWGHTGRDVWEGLEISRERADQLLDQDIREAEVAVDTMVKLALTPNQFSALVSLVYNIGSGNFYNSDVLKCLRRYDLEAAGAAFMRHVYGRGNPEPLPGLVRRRGMEKGLFLSDLPQANT